MRTPFILIIAFFAFNSNALANSENSSDTNSEIGTPHKEEKKTNKVKRIFTFAAMTDVLNENSFDGVLDNPKLGFDFSYNREEKGKMFSRGLSFGWQPLQTTNDSVVLNGIAGNLKAVNQMIHLHYTLRVAFFRNSGFQPYIEGIVGGKGAALTTHYSESTNLNGANEVPYFATTWNMGYATGIRLRATELLYLDIRYARIQSGDLLRITDVNVDDTGDLSYSTDAWKVPVGYLRAGLSLSF